MKFNKLLFGLILVFFEASSCLPIVDSRCTAVFNNRTTDTLIIGASFVDDINSVHCLLDATTYTHNFIESDTNNFSLWNKTIQSNNIVYPDSSCVIEDYDLFHNTDTCYFFMINLKNAKKHSWNEICKKKIFYKKIVTRDFNGKVDTDIRY